MPDKARVIVFAKAPRLGTVKTRLAAGLGPDGPAQALAIHRRLVEHTVAEARKVCSSGVNAGAVTFVEGPGRFVDREGTLVADVSLVVATTPVDAVPEVRAWLGEDLDVRAQRGDDLGARMASAMADAFAEGARRVVIVGSDVPRLAAAHLRIAILELWAEVDVVLGPAVDGGYWLVGARDRVPPVFSGIAWSSENVFRDTTERLESAHLRAVTLETLHDLDTAADLARDPDSLL